MLTLGKRSPKEQKTWRHRHGGTTQISPQSRTCEWLTLSAGLMLPQMDAYRSSKCIPVDDGRGPRCEMVMGSPDGALAAADHTCFLGAHSGGWDRRMSPGDTKPAPAVEAHLDCLRV